MISFKWERNISMKQLNDSVRIAGKRLRRLPLMNGKYLFEDIYVAGSFDCDDNYLKSLEGSPRKVNLSFYCRHNNLTTLKGCPEYIGGDFDCSFNDLINLDYIPKYVGGSFWCPGNPNLAQNDEEDIDRLYMEIRSKCRVVKDIYV